MKITLKDGSVKEYASAMTVIDIAADLSDGLARMACAGEVDGNVVDLRTVVDQDCEVNILTTRDKAGLSAYRHTCSHVLAEAVKNLYPEAKLAIGPSIETGFYYDFDMPSLSREDLDKIEAEMKQIINRIIEKNSEETIERFADYRNYMNYEILISNQILDRAKLSRQTGYNSGAEVQIPYLLILSSALLMIYNQRVNSTRLVFIDEPFAKMDPGNVKLMLKFMREQRLQVIFCSPDNGIYRQRV